MTSTYSRTMAATVVALTFGAAALTGCAPQQGGSASDQGSSASSHLEAQAQEQEKSVESAFGPVTIPAKPQRVVTLEGGVGPVLQAGTTPVATADGDAEDSLLPAEYQKVKDLPIILTPDGWDYEKIAAAKPDLLIGFVRGGKDEKISAESKAEWEKLSKIAPTVFILSEGSAQTKEAARSMSTALGQGESADAARAAYDAKAEQIKRDYAAQLDTTTFAAVDYYEGVTTVYTPISWLGGILKDAGAKTATVAAAETASNGVDLSSERLGELKDVDVFLTEKTVSGAEGEGAKELAAVPTFKELPAVKAGDVRGVSYFFADRYETGLKVLEQLENILKERAA